MIDNALLMGSDFYESPAERATCREDARRGDELVTFFEEFEKMVVSLRKRQEAEIAQLEKAIGMLTSAAEPAMPCIVPTSSVRHGMPSGCSCSWALCAWSR